MLIYFNGANVKFQHLYLVVLQTFNTPPNCYRIVTIIKILRHLNRLDTQTTSTRSTIVYTNGLHVGRCLLKHQ